MFGNMKRTLIPYVRNIRLWIFLVSCVLQKTDATNCQSPITAVPVCTGVGQSGRTVYLSGVSEGEDTENCVCEMTLESRTIYGSRVTVTNLTTTPTTCDDVLQSLTDGGQAKRLHACTSYSPYNEFDMRPNDVIQLRLFPGAEGDTPLSFCIKITAEDQGSSIKLNCEKVIPFVQPTTIPPSTSSTTTTTPTTTTTTPTTTTTTPTTTTTTPTTTTTTPTTTTTTPTTTTTATTPTTTTATPTTTTTTTTPTTTTTTSTTTTTTTTPTTTTKTTTTSTTTTTTTTTTTATPTTTTITTPTTNKTNLTIGKTTSSNSGGVTLSSTDNNEGGDSKTTPTNNFQPTLKPAPNPAPSTDTEEPLIGLILGLVISLLVLIALVVFVIWAVKKKNRERVVITPAPGGHQKYKQTVET